MKRLQRVHICESRNPPTKFRKRSQKGDEKYEPYWFWWVKNRVIQEQRQMTSEEPKDKRSVKKIVNPSGESTLQIIRTGQNRGILQGLPSGEGMVFSFSQK